MKKLIYVFSSPFSGTFFQSVSLIVNDVCYLVFVPFLGDFFSIAMATMEERKAMTEEVFVPFLGDFFSIGSNQVYGVSR